MDVSVLARRSRAAVGGAQGLRHLLERPLHREQVRGSERSGIGKIRAFLDNQVVVDQINEEAEVKSADLKPLYARTCRLLDWFSDCRVYWVPRARNKRADRLVHGVLYPNVK